MSKVAGYLQSHIIGEVSTSVDVLRLMSHDASPLELMPEMVVYPRTTNDVRKTARFVWQLAEKGHNIAITPRGGGSDQTGAAIGHGVILNFSTHMNQIFEYEPRQRFVRVQPGVNMLSLNQSLALNDAFIPSYPSSQAIATIGGAVANNATGPLSGRYGSMRRWTYELEVVLSNGDVLQTKRLSKRELGKKRTLQTFEGEIYRCIDDIIIDNPHLIDGIQNLAAHSCLGYTGLAEVKRRDGSFDLTPLIVGSQGTLGIVTEMIMKCAPTERPIDYTVIAFGAKEQALESIATLRQFAPSVMEYYDMSSVIAGSARGKSYKPFIESIETAAGLIVIGFDDHKERVRRKKLKNLLKTFQNSNVVIVTGANVDPTTIDALRASRYYGLFPSSTTLSSPPIADGLYVPPDKLESFMMEVGLLADKHRTKLSLWGRLLDNVYYVRPELQLKKASDRHKLYKLVDDFTQLMIAMGGASVAEAGEGRLLGRFAYAAVDPALLEVFTRVKQAFDPYGILNPGVKTANDIKDLDAQLRQDYSLIQFANSSVCG